MTRTMTEKEQKILETFAEIIPRLSELDKERLLMFGEGMKFKVEEQAKAAASYGREWHENAEGVHGYDPGADPCGLGCAGESENQGADRNGE